MNNPIIPKLETQQKYPLFYAEATKTINDVIEHITKERGVYSSNIEPDPKEHNIWFNTNYNRLYRWVEEEQSWKIISGGSSEIVYFTEFKGDFYNGKTYIFDGNKYGSNISRVSAIEPITNFEAILINCDFINSDNGEYDIEFKYIGGNTNTTKGIYYVKYIDGYCTVTKLTDNIIIYGKNISGAELIAIEGVINVPEGIITGNDYIEIIDNSVETIGIHVNNASMLEIPQGITFFPYRNFTINKLILYGGIDLSYADQGLNQGTINNIVIYNKNVNLRISNETIYIDTIITDHPIECNCDTVQTNDYSNPPYGIINNMILCNTEDYYKVTNDYNIVMGYGYIPIYTLYGKFNINFTLGDINDTYKIVFTEIPEYIKINDTTGGQMPFNLYIYCQNKHKEQIEKVIADAKLTTNINVIYNEININSNSNTINITDNNKLDININKNYIK